MEPLNLMVTLNLVTDDVRHEVTGHGGTSGRHQDQKKRSGWSALWRKVIARAPRREVHPRRATVLR